MKKTARLSSLELLTSSNRLDAKMEHRLAIQEFLLTEDGSGKSPAYSFYPSTKYICGNENN